MSKFEQFELNDWLQFIETQHPVTMDLSLTRVRSVAESLDLLTMGCPVITVAGTNGKGSVCAFAESVLLAGSLTVGVYTSPHLIKYNERVRINGQPATDHKLCESFRAIQAHCQYVTLTYFEYATLSALYLFKQHPLDYLILEVGLGGRKDAVNIIDADVAVITSIDLDHQQWLGDTKDSIGYEKSGIFRPYKLAVFGDVEMPDSVHHAALNNEVKLFQQGVDFYYKDKGETWDWYCDNSEYRNLPKPEIHLQNASTTLMTLNLLHGVKLTAPLITKGIQTLQLKARQQFITGKPCHLFDVAHNPQATNYLATTLKNLPYKPVYAVVGMLQDKDITESLKPLLPHIDKWFVAGLDLPRGASAKLMLDKLQDLQVLDVTSYVTPELAYHACLDAIAPDGLIVIFGSFHTVSNILITQG